MFVSETLEALVQACRNDNAFLNAHISQKLLEIGRQNPQLNALTSFSEDQSRRQIDALARVSMERRQDKSLFGMAISVKDNICTHEFKTTAGSRVLENFLPCYDATAVKRCKDAGAIVIGKTNCDEFAMGSSTETSIYGATKNPWDKTCVAGGTSGGAAAAVASGMCDAALGSDTGGSVRQPAAFCGVVGFKPTYGSVSRYGLIAHGSSLDQIGILARQVAHIRTIFDVVRGIDPMDSTSRDIQPKKPISEKSFPRIAVLDIGNSCQPEISDHLSSSVSAASNLGWSVERISMAQLDIAVPLYYILSTAEAASNLSRYDGIRFGTRSSNPDLTDSVEQFRSENFGSEVKRRILLGTFILSEGYFDKYYSKATKIRDELRAEVARIFSRFDLILLPTTPTTAFKIGEKVNDPVSMYLSDVFTTVANLAGIPAISIPVGFDSKGLPIGLQLMASFANDHYLLDVAEQFESLRPTYQKRPPSHA